MFKPLRSFSSFVLILTLFCAAAHANDNTIHIVYPKENAVIPASSTFLVGSYTGPVQNRKTLTVNTEKLEVNKEGFFAQVVHLSPGKNTFHLKSSDGQSDWSIAREPDPIQLKPNLLQFDNASIEPKENLGVECGDLISFSARATPGSKVSAMFESHKVTLQPKSRGIGPGSDQYAAFYRVTNEDHWQNVPVKFTLAKNGNSISVSAQGRLTVVSQPFLAETKHAPTIVRLGPGLARTTPLTNGIRLMVDGWKGDEMRCLYSPNLHVWINKDELSSETKNPLVNFFSGLIPTSSASKIIIDHDDYGEMGKIPLSQKLPYQIEQSLKPNQLVLRLYGVTADTDWIVPTVSTDSNKLIDHITWKQVNDSVYEVTFHLRDDNQWGYWAEYDGGNCVLHVKKPPSFADGSLHNLSICLDPGHGGNETGSIGCSGVKESDLNLAIASKLRNLLTAQGANVIMTRTTDVDLGLAERVKIAVQNRCDILLSIHNNALPDGGDPIKEHGTTTFWYHPQSIELARALKNGIVGKVGFPDLGARYQNLALARPSEMPAVLIECGFMINPDEYARLIAPEVQQKIADGLLDGLTTYIHQNRKQ